MDEEQFLKIIAEYGEENVIYLGFDNSGRFTYASEDKIFSLAQNYVPSIQSLVDVYMDQNNVPIRSVRPLSNLQSIQFVSNPIHRLSVSTRGLGW